MRNAVIALLLLGCGVRPYAHLTPLVDAARAGDAAAVRSLLAGGADPNEPAGNNGWTPLLHAIHKQQIGSVEALLEGGADVNRPSPDRTTPLMMAAGYGYTDIVRVLLRRGADPRIADGSGYHAVDLAAAGISDIDRFTLFRCQEDTVALLRAADPAVHINSKVLLWARAKRCRV
jgi:ankyrin repeat protein